MREFDVATLGEGRMMFKFQALLPDLINVIGEDDVVGIAHRDECSQRQVGHRLELLRNNQLGFSHVNGDALHPIGNDMQL